METVIYVDFNTMTMHPDEKVYIPTHMDALQAVRLRPGMRVVLHDEELEVAAIVDWDPEDASWWGLPDWSTSRDLPIKRVRADHPRSVPPRDEAEPDTESTTLASDSPSELSNHVSPGDGIASPDAGLPAISRTSAAGAQG